MGAFFTLEQEAMSPIHNNKRFRFQQETALTGNTRTSLIGMVLLIWLNTPLQAAALEVRVGYIQWHPDPGPVLSNIIPEPADSGLRGAELAVADNNTTGRFLDQHFSLSKVLASSEKEAVEAAATLAKDGIRLLVLNVPASTVLTIAKQQGDNALLFNAGARANSLRLQGCPTNLVHTQVSHAMLTDALAQWLSARRWKKLFLITGPTGADKDWAEAFRRATRRFGLTLVADKPWTFNADLRRTASKELPLFTQASDYDAVVVADERGDFGEYVPFNTWLPRPVVGTQGLTPVAWHFSIENWGAAQLQSRLYELAGRHMTGDDYAAWLAVRTVGEALIRTKSAEPADVRRFIFSDKFELGGFKGRKLSFRAWNGQLRQPVPLVQPHALVAEAPIEGFLHPRTELDTLGYDKPESQCRINP